jgi:hypothetical protein
MSAIHAEIYRAAEELLSLCVSGWSLDAMHNTKAIISAIQILLPDKVERPYSVSWGNGSMSALGQK